MIDRLYKLDINGTGQWFLERGSADARHMVLFVHGGPDCTLMIFSRAFDTHLLDEFPVLNRRGLNGSLLIAWTTAVSIANGNAEHPTASQLEFFETPIRPMLAEP